MSEFAPTQQSECSINRIVETLPNPKESQCKGETGELIPGELIHAAGTECKSANLETGNEEVPPETKNEEVSLEMENEEVPPETKKEEVPLEIENEEVPPEPDNEKEGNHAESVNEDQPPPAKPLQITTDPEQELTDTENLLFQTAKVTTGIAAVGMTLDICSRILFIYGTKRSYISEWINVESTFRIAVAGAAGIVSLFSMCLSGLNGVKYLAFSSKALTLIFGIFCLCIYIKENATSFFWDQGFGVDSTAEELADLLIRVFCLSTTILLFCALVLFSVFLILTALENNPFEPSQLIDQEETEWDTERQITPGTDRELIDQEETAEWDTEGQTIKHIEVAIKVASIKVARYFNMKIRELANLMVSTIIITGPVTLRFEKDTACLACAPTAISLPFGQEAPLDCTVVAHEQDAAPTSATDTAGFRKLKELFGYVGNIAGKLLLILFGSFILIYTVYMVRLIANRLLFGCWTYHGDSCPH